MPAYRRPTPPPGGFTAGDLDRIPDLPPHTELIDGALIFRAPQTLFHMRAITLLGDGLRRLAPQDVRIRREMTITIGERQRPEPDVLVVNADAEADDDQTSYSPDGVLLVVEVVSPDSEERDRERKPQLYARAGIRHFWRVENGGGGNPIVYVYELDPATMAYALTGIHHNELTLTVPFHIDIDLSEIDHL